MKAFLRLMRQRKKSVVRAVLYQVFLRCARHVHLAICRVVFRIQCFWTQIEVGPKVRVFGVPVIMAAYGNIKIEEGVKLYSSSYYSIAASLNHRTRLSALTPSGHIRIGRYTAINGCSLTCRSTQILIGEYTLFGPNCVVMDFDGHRLWPPEARDVPSVDLDQPVLIGNRVWIGMNCIILKGSRIGNNSIIAAGSLVKGEIPENCLAAGQPARPLKFFA